MARSAGYSGTVTSRPWMTTWLSAITSRTRAASRVMDIDRLKREPDGVILAREESR